LFRPNLRFLSLTIVNLLGKSQISLKIRTSTSHFEHLVQYIIYFEPKKREKKKTNTGGVVITILNVLPAIRHMLDKLEELSN